VTSTVRTGCARPPDRHTVGLGPDGRLTGLAGHWTLAASYTVGLVGPTVRQRSAGQHWGACVAYAVGTASTQPGTPAPVGYEGSLRDAFGSGAPPAVLGRCGTDNAVTLLAPHSSAWSTPCTSRHNREILAYRIPPQGTATTAEESATATRDNNDCRLLAQRFLHRSDPSADGQLQVAAGPVVSSREFGVSFTLTVDPAGNVVATDPSSADAGAACLIAPAAPTRALGRSLLGIGTGEMPWA
jgi:hypothetical protein